MTVFRLNYSCALSFRLGLTCTVVIQSQTRTCAIMPIHIWTYLHADVHTRTTIRLHPAALSQDLSADSPHTESFAFLQLKKERKMFFLLSLNKGPLEWTKEIPFQAIDRVKVIRVKVWVFQCINKGKKTENICVLFICSVWKILKVRPRDPDDRLTDWYSRPLQSLYQLPGNENEKSIY